MDFKLHKSQLIVDNQLEMIEHIHQSHKIHQDYFKGKDSTWSYREYNFFALSSPSLLFNKLFFELKDVINDYVPYEFKWMQSWVNYHYPNQVLNWHNHFWDYHGYICIDPKNTRTVFKEYEIKNEIGNIYIGPGEREHTVIVDEDYDSPRITIGFDIQIYKNEKILEPNAMLSLIPI